MTKENPIKLPWEVILVTEKMFDRQTKGFLGVDDFLAAVLTEMPDSTVKNKIDLYQKFNPAAYFTWKKVWLEKLLEKDYPSVVRRSVTNIQMGVDIGKHMEQKLNTWLVQAIEDQKMHLEMYDFYKKRPKDNQQFLYSVGLTDEVIKRNGETLTMEQVFKNHPDMFCPIMPQNQKIE